jgi:hypothetical protein
VKLLVIGSDERHITSSLVRHHGGPIALCTTSITASSKKNSGAKHGGSKGIGQKMTMGTAVWFVSVVLKVL